MKRTFILKKDLFKLKKGRVFHTTHDGKTLYPYFTDDEVIYNKEDFFLYKFPIDLVDNDEDGWFEEITERNGFVKQLSGSYKFVFPPNMQFPNSNMIREVRKDGIVVGHVTNFDMGTGQGTIEILPEYAESIWKEIAGPYVGLVTSRTLDTPEKVDDVINDFLKDEGTYKQPEIIEDDEDLGDLFFDVDEKEYTKPPYSIHHKSDTEDIDDLFKEL